MSEENRKKKHQKYNSSREITATSQGNLDISQSLLASMDSGIETTDQIMNQDLHDIIRMSQESLIDSFKSMETVIR